MAGQIKSWVREETGLRRFIYHYSGWIGLFIGVLFVSLNIWGAYWALGKARHKFQEKIDATIAGSADERISFLLRALIDNPMLYYDRYLPLGLLAALVAGFVLIIVVTTLADNPPRSFLVLSDKAAKERELQLRERIWTWRYFIGTAIASTIAGFASRYLFALLMG